MMTFLPAVAIKWFKLCVALKKILVLFLHNAIRQIMKRNLRFELTNPFPSIFFGSSNQRTIPEKDNKALRNVKQIVLSTAFNPLDLLLSNISMTSP